MAATNARTPIPVILDTDIGTDIDDTWALAMLLNSPELDLRLVVSATGDTRLRARLTARLLEVAGRSDIPIGVGLRLAELPIHQAAWVEDYPLARYPGPVHPDGVDAMVETIMASPEPVTVIGIGPLPNVAAALARQPRIAERARFVGMQGSVRRGYGGRAQADAEYNVYCYPWACRQTFNAPWPVTITPVDTCSLVRLSGTRYAAVRDCLAPLARAVIENYRIWARSVGRRSPDPEQESTTLFDTVAIYLAFAEDLLVLEEIGIEVTDDGYTRIDENARKVRCATDWRDQEAFEALLVERLTGGR